MALFTGSSVIIACHAPLDDVMSCLLWVFAAESVSSIEVLLKDQQ